MPRSYVMPLLTRLQDKFLVGDGCWEWIAAKNPVAQGAYGRVGTGARGGKLAMAHKVVYELLEGRIPEGHQLHHECENASCVRPAHMRCVSNEEHQRLHPNNRWKTRKAA